MAQMDPPWGTPRRGGFRNEDEALEGLAEARTRLIHDGYEVAVALAEKNGTVHSQMVLAEMESRGLFLESDEDIPRNWTAVIFKGKQFKDTWQPAGFAKIGDSSRNTHAATRRVWKLAGAPDPVAEAAPPPPAQDSRLAPETPSQEDILLAVAEFKAGLGIALKRGYKIKSPVALRRVGLWLRYTAGENIDEEVLKDEAIPELPLEPVGICSVCGEHQYPTPSGACCPQGHGGAPSVGTP